MQLSSANLPSFYSKCFKSQAIRVAIACLSGLMFGAGMVISGMTDPKNVIAFLNITGNWDPSLAFVMGGAILVFMPGYHFLIKPRETAFEGNKFNLASKNQIDKNLLAGSSLFGIGWGLTGICPGPAIASVSLGSPIILGFIFSMLFGMILASFCLKKSNCSPERY